MFGGGCSSLRGGLVCVIRALPSLPSLTDGTTRLTSWVVPFSLLLIPSLLTYSHMETWMTSQCGSAASWGKSLGYSGLTRRRAGYADFSRSLHQRWGMAPMQSKLPLLCAFHYIIVSFWQVRTWYLIYFQGKKKKKLQERHWSALHFFFVHKSVYYFWQANSLLLNDVSSNSLIPTWTPSNAHQMPSKNLSQCEQVACSLN